MAKKGKGILKRVGTALVIGYFTFAIGFLSFYAGAAIKSGLSTKYKYNPPAYVQALMQDFDVSNDYLSVSDKGYYRRLEYNEHAPIFVSFSKEYEEHPEFMEAAIEALDDIFGLVGRINPKYTYKVVSEAERVANTVIGRSTIKFEAGHVASGNNSGVILAVERKKFNFYDITPKDYNFSSNRIVVDFDELSKRFERQKFYTIKHELLHAFGFDDVYKNYSVNGVHYVDTQRRLRGDTYMDVIYGQHLGKITPKDFATLCALYMPKTSGDDLDLKENMQKLIDEYAKEYYQAFDEKCMERLLNTEKYEAINFEQPKNISSLKIKINYVEHGINRIKYTFLIKIDGDKYTFKIYDKDDKFVDSYSGNVVKTEHFLLLENCYFKNGILPDSDYYGYDDGYIQNICIFKNEDKAGIYLLDEYSDCIASEVTYEAEQDDSNTL